MSCPLLRHEAEWECPWESSRKPSPCQRDSPFTGWHSFSLSGLRRETGGREEKGCLLLSTTPFLPTEKQYKSTKHQPLVFNVLGKLQARPAPGTGCWGWFDPTCFIKESQCSFTPEILMCWNKVGAKQDYILASSDAFMQKTVYTKGANFNLRM